MITIDWSQAGPQEIVGFIASFLVFLTFFETDMKRLRIVAIVSNIMFIFYASLRDLPPVLCLHILLLPLNAIRLRQIYTQENNSKDSG
ncbi:hypothetical protein [Parendozoicomonas haliclonae]|uniref:Uncharacterized protein n=1 Tax=Parendozoicomonas haliclonae TaxID=1960125 RepID=A0A1X7AQ61_9GAMM|nr:hypothetical protein [Parendozoicomonas haliclonae]SMA50238.1 hypothetical protein EHSB41UT_04031 [Parendozoicomonas haliclonae]